MLIWPVTASLRLFVMVTSSTSRARRARAAGETIGRHLRLVGSGDLGARDQTCLDARPVRGPQDHEPSGFIRILVGERGLRYEIVVDRYDLARGSGLRRADPLPRFDGRARLARLYVTADLLRRERNELTRHRGGDGGHAELHGPVGPFPEPDVVVDVVVQVVGKMTPANGRHGASLPWLSSRALAQRARRAAELAQLLDLHLAVDEQREMPHEHRHHLLALGDAVVLRRERQEVVVVDDFPAGLAARVEARRVLCALPVQREQSKSLAPFERRRGAARLDPAFEHLFGVIEQLLRDARRLSAGREAVDLLEDPRARRHASPFAFSAARPSDTFSWMPRLRGDRPSAMPSSCVK